MFAADFDVVVQRAGRYGIASNCVPPPDAAARLPIIGNLIEMNGSNLMTMWRTSRVPCWSVCAESGGGTLMRYINALSMSPG